MDVTELAGALAIEELTKNGNTKSARRLFQRALLAPNDNVVAQAQWAARNLGFVQTNVLSVDNRILEVSEAACYQALSHGDLRLAYQKALSWHVDEPFASRPMIAASYLASMLRDFRDAVMIAGAGLVIEPDNVALLNNQAFSQLCLGNLEEALESLTAALRVGDIIDPHTVANLGLLAYLSLRPDVGFQAYTNATKAFEHSGKKSSAVMARVFHAFAAKNVNDPRAVRLLEEARVSVGKLLDPLVQHAARSILDSRDWEGTFRVHREDFFQQGDGSVLERVHGLLSKRLE